MTTPRDFPAWLSCCSPRPEVSISRRSVLCSVSAGLLPFVIYRDCRSWLLETGFEPAFRGEELPVAQSFLLSNPVSDLDTVYGELGQQFFSQLQLQLEKSAASLPSVFDGHLLTGSYSDAAQWGRPSRIFTVGHFSYLWFAGEDPLVYNPEEDGDWQKSNPFWNLDQLAERKGPIRVNTGLAEALHRQHEVLYWAPNGYYLFK